MRLVRGSGRLVAIVAGAAAVTQVISGGGASAAAPTAKPAKGHGSPPAVRAAVGALGTSEVAYVVQGNLYLLGGPVHGRKRVNLPGTVFAPAWSANHRWLAVEVSPLAPAAAPGQGGLEKLWVVSARGRVVRPLTSASWDVTGFAWAPRASTLAVTAIDSGGPPSRAWDVLTVTPAGRPTELTTAAYGTGVAWSPDGRRVAAGLSSFRDGHWVGRLVVLNPNTGARATVTMSTDNVLELASWWPDGSGLLYWIDPQGSSSIAADGLPLDTLALAGGRAAARPRRLIDRMLVHSSWLAFGPGGHRVVAVAGGDREIWSGHKHLVLCRPSGCRTLTRPAGAVDLQPSWSATGAAVVFTRASASGPFGPGGHAQFSAKWIRRWQATSRMRVMRPSGAGGNQVTPAGRGAVDPVPGRDGSIMFVRSDSIWILPAAATAPVRLTGPLGVLGTIGYRETYYGYVPYPELIAWTGALPSRTAGPG